MFRPAITPGLLLLAAAFVLDACTGTLPGYGTPEARRAARYQPPPTARPTPSPRYEPLSPGGRYGQAPEPTPAPSYASSYDRGSEPGTLSPPPTERPVRDRPAEPTSPASREEPVSYESVRETASSSPRPAPTPAPAAPTGTDFSRREQQIAILTNAVTTLRRELSESYEYTEELEQERERLQSQVQRLRKELADSQAENSRLRKRLEELERRLDEISPPPAPATTPAG